MVVRQLCVAYPRVENHVVNSPNRMVGQRLWPMPGLSRTIRSGRAELLAKVAASCRNVRFVDGSDECGKTVRRHRLLSGGPRLAT